MTVAELAIERPNLTREGSEGVGQLAAGRSIIIVHPLGAAIVFAAATASTRQTAWAIRHSSGFLQVAVPAPTCDRLLIPQAAEMYGRRQRSVGSHQCVGVDAASGIGTGISAADRTRTARVLADPSSTMSDLTRPGHLIPVAVDPEMPPATELPTFASFLADAATGNPAAVFTELALDIDPVNSPTRQDIAWFARAHGVRTLSMTNEWDSCPQRAERMVGTST